MLEKMKVVPLIAFTENSSSITLMAPHSCGKEIGGISIALDLVFAPSLPENWKLDLFDDSSFILSGIEQFEMLANIL